jgi:predicted TIM-barrel fold metal-dependent hydrolase
LLIILLSKFNYLTMNLNIRFANIVLLVIVVLLSVAGWNTSIAQQKSATTHPDIYLFNDDHVHLTNYIQKGPTVQKFLEVMGNTVGRAVLFGIPLQQQWSYANTGSFAPWYYTQTDAPLYYYSFTDAYIAMAYKSLTPEQQQRIDPMITGFNPTDMYAADHIRRVLTTFPGVFTGIGEFTIHKEFVSSKIAGEVSTIGNPALDSIFSFCAETGLLIIIHSDIDMPFPKPGQEPYQVTQLRDLFARHPDAPVIWSHCGLGRVVEPIHDMIGILLKGLSNPKLSHVYFDLSWDEAAKYVVATPESIKATAGLINMFPDRFLFGTDEVGPTDQAKYMKVYNMYAPLLEQLTPDAREKFLKGNYERLFDNARKKVRAWERENIK